MIPTTVIFAIVDDECKYREAHRMALDTVLERFAETIIPRFVVFKDGRDALNWFRTRGHGDGVILTTDINMVYMSGVELLRGLRESTPSLLPTHCAVISTSCLENTREMLKNWKLGDLPIHVSQKNFGYRDYMRFVSTALTQELACLTRPVQENADALLPQPAQK